MYIGIKKEKTTHTRTSKLGQEHTYVRERSIAEFRCDSCQALFSRPRGKMDPKRLNNNFFHVCSNCDAKRFAQSKGVEMRNIWEMPASSLKTLGTL